MYYLRKEPYKQILLEIRKTNGEVIPEREVMIKDRAIFKHPNLLHFYRGEFTEVNNKYQGMKLYTCKTLKHILKIRKSTFEYSSEWFDIYDENGKVELKDLETEI